MSAIRTEGPNGHQTLVEVGNTTGMFLLGPKNPHPMTELQMAETFKNELSCM